MQKFSSSYMLMLIKSILRLFGLGCGITIAVVFVIPTAFFLFGIYLIDVYSNWLNFDSVDSGINRLFRIKAVTKVEENPLPEIKEPLLSSDFTQFDRTLNPEKMIWEKYKKPFDHQMTLQSKGQTNRNLISHDTFLPPVLSTIDFSSELQIAFHAMPQSYQSINRLVVKICGVEIIVCFVDPLEGVGYSQHRWIGCASYAVGRIYLLKFPNYNTIMHELIHMYCYLTGQNDRSSFNAHEDMVEFMGSAFFLLREACESINQYCVNNIGILINDSGLAISPVNDDSSEPALVDYMVIPDGQHVLGLPEKFYFSGNSESFLYTYESLVSLHADDSFVTDDLDEIRYTRTDLLNILNHKEICIVRHPSRERGFESICRNALKDQKCIFVCVDGLGIIDCAKWLHKMVRMNYAFKSYQYSKANVLHLFNSHRPSYVVCTPYFEESVESNLMEKLGSLIDECEQV